MTTLLDEIAENLLRLGPEGTPGGHHEQSVPADEWRRTMVHPEDLANLDLALTSNQSVFVFLGALLDLPGFTARHINPCITPAIHIEAMYRTMPSVAIQKCRLIAGTLYIVVRPNMRGIR